MILGTGRVLAREPSTSSPLTNMPTVPPLVSVTGTTLIAPTLTCRESSSAGSSGEEGDRNLLHCLSGPPRRAWCFPGFSTPRCHTHPEGSLPAHRPTSLLGRPIGS